jgi:hypothetical protein
MVSGLCRYRDELGSPGQGFHRRVGGVAIADVLGTVAIAAGAAAAYRYRGGKIRYEYAALVAFVILMVAAVALHRAFCVDTALTVALFGPSESAAVKPAAVGRDL